MTKHPRRSRQEQSANARRTSAGRTASTARHSASDRSTERRTSAERKRSERNKRSESPRSSAGRSRASRRRSSAKRQTELQRREPRTLTPQQSIELRKQRARQRRRHRALFRLFAMLITCAAAIFATSLFFQVSTVTVSGHTQYVENEIINASGISTGDNLLFIRKNKVVQRLQNTYPYLDSVKIKSHFPSSIEIEVADRAALLAVKMDTGVYLLDKTGKVLEQVSTAKGLNLIDVTGVDTDGLTVGETIREENSEDEERFEKLQSVLDIVEWMTQYELIDRVKGIDVTKSYDVSLNYDGRYTVEFGELDHLEHKVQFLQAILRESSLPDSGVIDLTDEDQARYRPADSTKKTDADKSSSKKTADSKKKAQTSQTEGKTNSVQNNADSAQGTENEENSKQNAETSKQSPQSDTSSQD